MIKKLFWNQLYSFFALIILFNVKLAVSSMLDLQSRLNYLDHKIKVLEFNAKAHKNIYELISQYVCEKDGLNAKEINSELEKNYYLEDLKPLRQERARLQILKERFEKIKIDKENNKVKTLTDAKDKSVINKGTSVLDQEFTKISRILFKLNYNGKYIIDSSLSNQTYTQKLFFSESSFITTSEFSNYFTDHGNYVKNVNGRIIQLKAVLQVSENGGGNATCGYQALLNGFIIARLILSSCTQRALILPELMDKNLRMELFGDEKSLWRSAIINSRKRNILKKFFFNFLLMGLYDDENLKKRIVKEKIKDREHRSLSRFIDDEECQYIYFNKLDNIKDENERKFFMDNATLNLLSHSIVKYLQQQNDNKIIINDELLLKIFLPALKYNENFAKVFNEFDHEEKENKIKKYFPGIKNSIEVVKDIEFSDEVVQDTNGIPLLPYEWSRLLSGKLGSKPGEWLFGEEIFNIIEIEKTEGNIFKSIFDHQNSVLFNNLPNDIVKMIYGYIEANSYFIQYGDIELTERMKTQIKKDEIPDPYSLREDFQELVQFVRNPNTQGFRIMTIIVAGNHWIACVINKRKRKSTEHIGDDIQYILADSMNDDYTRSRYIQELLERLEGREIPEFSQGASDAGWCVIA